MHQSSISLKRSFGVAASVVAGLLSVAAPAQAVTVYSGPVSIAIPDNIDGVYLNVVTGASGATAVSGWDINPYSALAGQFNLWGPTTTTWLSTTNDINSGYVLAAGTTIGAAGGYFRPGGNINVGDAVTLNASNLFGFRFTNESTGATNFGWVAITFGANAGTRTITGFAYDNAGASIGAGVTGVVPEPATVAMLLAGLAAVGGVAAKRRKEAAAA